MGSEPKTASERVKGMALALGFDVAGVARAEPTPETRFLRDWLDRGFAGDMAYLSRRAEERVDPRRVLEGARSVVAVGLVYDPGETAEAPPITKNGVLARYAGGEDYHDVLGERLRVHAERETPFPFCGLLPRLASAMRLDGHYYNHVITNGMSTNLLVNISIDIILISIETTQTKMSSQ